MRITVTPNNGLVFDERNIGRNRNSINHHNLNGDSFTLEGDTGIFLRLEALSVDSDPSMNTVTFDVSDLHTSVRNPTVLDDGAVYIALQVDMEGNAI